MYIGSPVDILSHAPTDLIPPAKNPNRPKLMKRKHDEVDDVDDAVERRKKRPESVVREPHGKAPAEQPPAKPAENPATKPREKLTEKPAGEPAEVRWKRKGPLLGPVATPAYPPGSFQNSTPAFQETPGQHPQPSENVSQEDGFQIPNIVSDEALSPPSLE